MSETIRPKRTGEDFARAAAERQIARWIIHRCSLCGYPCGYYFADGVVGYDSGCDCTDGGGLQSRAWDDVAALYNMQKNPRVIAEYDAFWGFDPSAPSPP